MPKKLSFTDKHQNGLRIVSFDVGIKNLSFCRLEVVPSSDREGVLCPRIIDWGIIDLTIPVQDLPTPWTPYLLSHFETMKSGELDNLMGMVELEVGKTKRVNIDRLHELIRSQGVNLGQKKTAKSIGSIAPIMYHRLDNIDFGEIDHVYIENQPSLRNPTMKTVQILLYSYFTLRKITDVPSGQTPVELFMVSANSKTKWAREKINLLGGVKDKAGEGGEGGENEGVGETKGKQTNNGKKYRQTKDITVKVTSLWLDVSGVAIADNTRGDGMLWKEVYTQHSKKDDLADSFLQACAFVDQNYGEKIGVPV